MQIFNDTVVFEPDELAAVFAEAGQRLADGRPVSILPADGELHLAAAADFLHVPNAFLAKLLDDAALPCRGTGFARFVPIRALAARRLEQAARTEAALGAMARQAQELGIYDFS